jgi:exonuclease III
MLLLSTKFKTCFDFVFLTFNDISRSKDGTRKTLIDYIMIPEFLCNGCSDLKVRNDCLYNVSDHYPISITLDTNFDRLISKSLSSSLL